MYYEFCPCTNLLEFWELRLGCQYSWTELTSLLITVLVVFLGRKLENILNNLATKLHKPQLNFADRLQIALGMQHIDWTFL